MNEEKLAAANGLKKDIFPYDERLMYAFTADGFINFTSPAGEEYRITLKNRKIVNREEVKESATVIERRTNHIFYHDNDYGVRCDTFSNNLFALGKDSTAAGAYNLDYFSLSEVTYRMKFFKAGYTVTRLGNHNSFNFFNFIQQGNTTYLNPCFLKDTYTGNSIHLKNPEGYLIVHQDILGSNSKAILTRIDTANKKIWETAMGVSTKIADCIISGKYCIISTNTSYMFSPHIGKDALCIIDTEAGKINRALLSE